MKTLSATNLQEEELAPESEVVVECAIDANVEVVELGVRGQATSGLAAKDGDR